MIHTSCSCLYVGTKNDHVHIQQNNMDKRALLVGVVPLQSVESGSGFLSMLLSTDKIYGAVNELPALTKFFSIKAKRYRWLVHECTDVLPGETSLVVSRRPTG